MGTRSDAKFRQQVQDAGYDCHEVAPDLWVGSKPHAGQYPFDVIVFCAVEYQPDAGDFPGVTVIHAPFDDTHNPTDSDMTTALRAAHTVLKHLKADKRVLVTCWAGQNRSAFVAALVMKRKWKAPTAEVIAQVQRAREYTLHNQAFCKILEKW